MTCAGCCRVSQSALALQSKGTCLFFGGNKVNQRSAGGGDPTCVRRCRPDPSGSKPTFNQCFSLSSDWTARTPRLKLQTSLPCWLWGPICHGKNCSKQAVTMVTTTDVLHNANRRPFICTQFRFYTLCPLGEGGGRGLLNWPIAIISTCFQHTCCWRLTCCESAVPAVCRTSASVRVPSGGRLSLHVDPVHYADYWLTAGRHSNYVSNSPRR